MWDGVESGKAAGALTWPPGLLLRACIKTSRGRDGADFAAGQGARARLHQEPDAPSPSNAGIQRKMPRPFGLRPKSASAASGLLAVPVPGTRSSPLLASIRFRKQRGSREVLIQALSLWMSPRREPSVVANRMVQGQ